jgi:N-acetylmuramoyl-L-alanine amidase
MRLYRRGDEGAAVRDIQDRLMALGFVCGGDPLGVFGAGTGEAVSTFQRKRGLAVDGIVGPDTWRGLVAAGYRLGDRMLYRRVPMMRGDDVAELQRRLNSLGFDAGKVDGIFGADTLAALLDFQSNRGMPEDGIAGPEVAAELDLMTRATAKPGRELVRERQWLRSLPGYIAGQRIFVDSFCRGDDERAATWSAAVTFSRIIQDLGAQPLLSRSIDSSPTERVRAFRANRIGADFVVAFALPRDGDPAVFYFASQHSSSAAGASLAEAVAGCLGLAPKGRSIPILKNTRSPAILVAVEPMDERVGGRVAQGIINLFAEHRE